MSSRRLHIEDLAEDLPRVRPEMYGRLFDAEQCPSPPAKPRVYRGVKSLERAKAKIGRTASVDRPS